MVPPLDAPSPLGKGRDMRWSAVIPVFNEADYLPATLASLIAQDEPVRIIVVDNGSTDGCIDAAREQARIAGADVLFLDEPTPGQVHALRRGIDAVTTELVAVCDADTVYPPHYLRRAGTLFDAGGPGRVMLGAWLKPDDGDPDHAMRARRHRLTAAAIWPRQNHTSGAAQLFRTEALRRAGGYDPARWPYVLKDHELAHRVLKLGQQAYDAELWCISSSRRDDRRGVRWTLFERLMYHFTPNAAKEWFFYSFLAGRFAARGQRDTVLRQRSWDRQG